MGLQVTVHVTRNLQNPTIPWNFVADSRELPCNQPRNARTLSANDMCSVRRMSEYYLLPTRAPNSLIVVAVRKSHRDPQDASTREENGVRRHNRFRICRSFSTIPWTLSKVSVDSVQTVCVRFTDDCASPHANLLITYIYGRSAEKSKLLVTCIVPTDLQFHHVMTFNLCICKIFNVFANCMKLSTCFPSLLL